MNKQAAIDSNVLVALVDVRDKWHGQAKALLDALKEGAVNVIYFDCVLNETISVLQNVFLFHCNIHRFAFDSLLVIRSYHI